MQERFPSRPLPLNRLLLAQGINIRIASKSKRSLRTDKRFGAGCRVASSP
jgi:hypothetical protein